MSVTSLKNSAVYKFSAPKKLRRPVWVVENGLVFFLDIGLLKELSKLSLTVCRSFLNCLTNKGSSPSGIRRFFLSSLSFLDAGDKERRFVLEL